MQSRCVIKCKGITEQWGFELPWKHKHWMPFELHVEETSNRSLGVWRNSPRDLWAWLGRPVGIMISDKASAFQLFRMSKGVGSQDEEKTQMLLQANMER